MDFRVSFVYYDDYASSYKIKNEYVHTSDKILLYPFQLETNIKAKFEKYLAALGYKMVTILIIETK